MIQRHQISAQARVLILSLLLAGHITDVFAAPPVLPTINTANVFNVTNAAYGAFTSASDNAAAIQSAINAASAATAGVGGGTVEIPGPGVYLCGPLTMKKKVNLQVDAGATLMMLAKASWPGSTAFITGSSLTDIEFSGSGTLDGQGAGWWNPVASSRPHFIDLSSCNRILIQDLKIQNPPTFTIYIKSKDSNITVQRINIDTDPTSPNTDGFDIGSTNILIQDSHISDGDDNIEIGGSSDLAAYITITNCLFGSGHGISMGSYVGAGVHDVTVINCNFTNTDNAIRMKSDSDRGGVVENLAYYNLGMTNIKYAPILIYSYYNTYGTPTTAGITPSKAATEAVSSVSSTTPIWRNIIISNLTATAGQPGMIWSRTELPATNITLAKLNISASGAFQLYNVRNVQVIDSVISTKTFDLFNCSATFSNSATGASSIALAGVSVTNPIAFYNQSASFSDASLFGATPINLGGSSLADGTAMSLAAATPVNFILGSNATTVAVTGSLALNGDTLNVTNGGGFAAGSYTLFSYTSGSLTGTPVLGATPSGYNYLLTNNAAARQLNLLVISTNTGVRPSITNQPMARGGYTGGTVTFALGAGGTPPLAYQWLFNSTNQLSTATSSTLTLTNLQLTNAGSYSAVVTNAYGATTTSIASLNVVVPPRFLSATGGGGGLPGSNFIVLSTTNLLLPGIQWTPLATNPFDASGNFTLTNSAGAAPQIFYRLRLP